MKLKISSGLSRAGWWSFPILYIYFLPLANKTTKQSMHFYINLGVCANYSQSFVSILMVKPKIWACKHRQCHAESQTKKKIRQAKGYKPNLSRFSAKHTPGLLCTFANQIQVFLFLCVCKSQSLIVISWQRRVKWRSNLHKRHAHDDKSRCIIWRGFLDFYFA